MKEHYLWVGLGGGLGSMARYACSGWAARLFGETFPWGTLLVNVVGSFLIGFIGTLTSPEGRWLLAPAGRDFILLGFCGGYTTFSSFSVQTLRLLDGGEWGRASANVVVSVLACLLAVWLGHTLAAWINAPRAS